MRCCERVVAKTGPEQHPKSLATSGKEALDRRRNSQSKAVGVTRNRSVSARARSPPVLGQGSQARAQNQLPPSARLIQGMVQPAFGVLHERPVPDIHSFNLHHKMAVQKSGSAFGGPRPVVPPARTYELTHTCFLSPYSFRSTVRCTSDSCLSCRPSASNLTLSCLRATVGLNPGRALEQIPKVAKPSQRKGRQSAKNILVRGVIREVRLHPAFCQREDRGEEGGREGRGPRGV